MVRGGVAPGGKRFHVRLGELPLGSVVQDWWRVQRQLWASMIDDDRLTLGAFLQANGYHTGAFGKWHLGSGEKFHPQARGFDEFFGFQGGMHSYFDPQAATGNPLLEGRIPVAETTYLTDALADHAVNFSRTVPQL